MKADNIHLAKATILVGSEVIVETIQ